MIPGYGMGRVWAGSGSEVGMEGGREGRVGDCFPVRCRINRGGVVRVRWRGGGVLEGGVQGFSGVGSRVGIGRGYPPGGFRGIGVENRDSGIGESGNREIGKSGNRESKGLKGNGANSFIVKRRSVRGVGGVGGLT